MKQEFKEGNAIIGNEICFNVAEIQRLATARDVISLYFTPECYIEAKFGKLTDHERANKEHEINRGWVEKSYTNKLAYLRNRASCDKFMDLYHSEVEFITKFLAKITYDMNGAASVDRELTEL